jgi:hypothetical protein
MQLIFYRPMPPDVFQAFLRRKIPATDVIPVGLRRLFPRLLPERPILIVFPSMFANRTPSFRRNADSSGIPFGASKKIWPSAFQFFID